MARSRGLGDVYKRQEIFSAGISWLLEIATIFS
jgi:hypothetical protein